jgi:ATP-binding cassette subfamily C protein
MIVTIGIASSLSSIYKALVMKHLIDSATNIQINNMIKSLILFGCIIIIDMILQAASSFLSTHSYNKLFNSIQKTTYLHIINTQWLEFSKYHSGDISTRLTNDIDSFANMVINIIPSIISSTILLIGSFITLLYFDLTIALIAISISPVLILIGRIYSTKLKKLYKLTQELESKQRSFLHESLQNIVVIKSFCNEKSNSNTFANLQNNKLKLKLYQNNISILNNSFFTAGSWLTFFVVFTWGAFNLSKGTTTYGTISALIQLFGNIQYPFSSLASSFPKVITSMASIERIRELENLKNDIKKDHKLINIRNVGIEFTNVSFSYIKGLPILDNLSLKINPGEIVAIVGPSGEGKTTLIRLILSLIYPENGHIFIENDNKKIQVDSSCRSLIAYVPQGNTLFSGSIAENLRYGNKNATNDELMKTSIRSNAWEFIGKLTEGLDTIIGERGVGLSEGQAQRIAIARALLKKSPILILDEATSALDAETELKVLETIRGLEHKPTCLIVTHRPSALAICDRILKLNKGYILEHADAPNRETAASIERT